MSKFAKRLFVTTVSSIALLAPVGITAASASASTHQEASVSVIQATCAYKARKASNVRSGPGTDFAVVGSIAKGKCAKVTGTAYGWSTELGGYTLWSHLSSGGWVRSDLLR